MKKTIVLAFAFILAVGCGLLHRTPEEEKQIARQVRQQLDARTYKIRVDFMMPMRGGTEPVSGSYYLEIDGDTIHSYLPYAGVAQIVPFDGGKGLNFDDEIQAYTDEGFKDDSRTITIKTNNGEDTLIYTVIVYLSGEASIHVQCRNRDSIGFRGTLDTREKEES